MWSEGEPEDALAWVAERFRDYAERETRGVSPAYTAWALAVAGDRDLCAWIAAGDARQRQPNLVFAAARLHGAVAGDADSLRRVLGEDGAAVRATIAGRSTQTNEAARCAVVLPALHRIGGPIALIEIGASAGLCLLPDRWAYRYETGAGTVRVGPPSAAVTLTCAADAELLPDGLAVPEVAWRAGLDLNPLDPADPDTVAWLTALVWPEHEDRRDRLVAALAEAARMRPPVARGDVTRDLPALLARVPASLTPVVVHSAVLGYLPEADRAAVVRTIRAAGAHRIGFEGRATMPESRALPDPVTPETLFVAALDGVPYAYADGHARALRVIGPDEA